MKLWRKRAQLYNEILGMKHQGRANRYMRTIKPQAHPLVLALLGRFEKVGQAC